MDNVRNTKCHRLIDRFFLHSLVTIWFFPVLLFQIRAGTGDNGAATRPGDVGSDGPQLSGFMEPRPWKRGEIPSGLLSLSRGRATRGTPCFVLFFARIATLTVRSASFIEVKPRKQAKCEPIYHNIELRNIHVATNCVSAAGAPRGVLSPKCAWVCFCFLPLYLPPQ